MAALVPVVLLGCSSTIHRSAPKSVTASALAGAIPVDPVLVGPEPESGGGVEEVEEGRVSLDGGAMDGEESIRISEGGDTLVDQRIVVDDLPVGRPYPIDGLIGQINGRPVFADEFLLPLEDRILRIIAEAPPANAIRDVDRLVASRFEEYVNSELIIAEAEGQLTTEQQQGVLAWLQGVQEQTITDRGGTRDSAARSIEDEYGIGLEEFMSQRRSVALAQDLIQKRVRPRAITSWRDVEQAYRRDFAKYNPPATVRIGRLRLHRQRQAEQVEEASRLFESGLDLEEVSRRMGLDGDLPWLQLELPAEGIGATSLAAPVKERLDVESRGVASEPLEQGPFISWFTVLGVDQAEGQSIYSPAVQIAIENELAGMRFSQEQARYIASLRDRWVAGDIEAMRTRLIALTRARYFSGR